jgi:glucose-1-phosphate cytidylyltransferase
MKVVILAGGFGTRISEESHLKPKPMIEIGGMPILWHIMKQYSYYGFNDFIICCGYKQYVIKEWFANYFLHNSDITFDFTDGNRMIVHNNIVEPWKVTLVDTGLTTLTGGRVKRIENYIENEPFMLTYGDGVSNINILELVKFHQLHGKMVTISAYNVGQRFGVLDILNNDTVAEIREKSEDDGSMINIGFMVCHPDIFRFIDGDSSVLEKEPLRKIASLGELKAYRHNGFWQCMDTMRDKEKLEKLWMSGKAPWEVWKERFIPEFSFQH